MPRLSLILWIFRSLCDSLHWALALLSSVKLIQGICSPEEILVVDGQNKKQVNHLTSLS